MEPMDRFLNSLKREKTKGVFNPWYDRDPDNDALEEASQQRLENLRIYLDERRRAEYLLLAEALGYQGGHFTGIPMTSERIILGHKAVTGILPGHICTAPLRRTSNLKMHSVSNALSPWAIRPKTHSESWVLKPTRSGIRPWAVPNCSGSSS